MYGITDKHYCKLFGLNNALLIHTMNYKLNPKHTWVINLNNSQNLYKECLEHPNTRQLGIQISNDKCIRKKNAFSPRIPDNFMFRFQKVRQSTYIRTMLLASEHRTAVRFSNGVVFYILMKNIWYPTPDKSHIQSSDGLQLYASVKRMPIRILAGLQKVWNLHPYEECFEHSKTGQYNVQFSNGL